MRGVRSHEVIFRDPERYSTFPWAAAGPAGIMLLVFRQADGFSRAAAKAGQVTHHDANSWIACVSSPDGGRSWDRDSYQVAYRSERGVNDPAISLMSDGRVILRVTELNVSGTGERGNLAGELISHRAEHRRVATGHGNLWAEADPVSGKAGAPRLVEAGELTRTFSREPVTELPDGTWLLPVYGGSPFKTDSAYLLRSFDKGVTWGDVSVILHDSKSGPSDMQGINFNETSILAFPDGEMLAVGRADESFHSHGAYIPVGGVGELYTARSFNWGLSWTRPERTGIFGQPAHVLRADGDRVICAYGHRRQPYGVRVVESADRGRSWRTEDTITLREDAPGWDMGYPMTVRVEEDLFLTVYYFSDAEGVRFIAGTTWSMD